MKKGHQNLGIGVNLRRQHFQDALEQTDHYDWIEVISENFMTFGGRPQEVLQKILEKKKVVAHGLSLNLASTSPLDKKYLEILSNFLDTIDAPWFSDHLCMAGAHGVHYHDLIPALRTKEVVDVVVDKINIINHAVKRPFAFENVSAYAESSFNEMGEAQFIQSILDRTNSYLLLDINNVYVNACNFGLDPKEYLDQIDSNRVIQIHLAGHERRDDLLIDTHGDHVCREVWKLYEWYLKKVNRPITTLIEWDNNLPDFSVLTGEAQRAREIQKKIFKQNHSERNSNETIEV